MNEESQATVAFNYWLMMRERRRWEKSHKWIMLALKKSTGDRAFVVFTSEQNALQFAANARLGQEWKATRVERNVISHCCQHPTFTSNATSNSVEQLISRVVYDPADMSLSVEEKPANTAPPDAWFTPSRRVGDRYESLTWKTAKDESCVFAFTTTRRCQGFMTSRGWDAEWESRKLSHAEFIEWAQENVKNGVAYVFVDLHPKDSKAKPVQLFSVIVEAGE